MKILRYHYRLEAITAQCEGMLIRNEKRVHNILTIVVDMYLYLVSTPAQPWKVHDPSLAVIITTLLTTLFTNGSQTNVDIAAQKLKVCMHNVLTTFIRIFKVSLFPIFFEKYVEILSII